MSSKQIGRNIGAMGRGIVGPNRIIYNSAMRSPGRPSFDQFEATSLYCPRCKAAVPVRKKLLLVLPEGDEYEYLCVYCSYSVGTKVEKEAPPIEMMIKP